MKDTDRILVGTSWTRSKLGQHHQIIGVIDSIGARGPRLKTDNQKYHRLVWAELGFSWLPADRRSNAAYQLWTAGNAMKVTVDKNLTVVKAEKDDEPVSKKEETVEVNNGTIEMTTPEVAVKECHGGWHRKQFKDGRVTYDLLPLTAFSIATHGPNTGKLGSVCDECKRKTDEGRERKKARELGTALPAPIPAPIPVPVVIQPGVVTETGITHRWKIIVIQEVEHLVQAKDFLDAAAQVSGTGEIVRVEKL